jgi:hypothetical protein
MNDILRLDILPKEQLALFEELSSSDFIKEFYLAGLKDIAAMKLEAIAGRGSKKDFVDMFFLLQQFSLEEIFSFHTQKYGTGLSNLYHLMKSLVYFADAEEEAMPLMIRPLKWDKAKQHIITVINHLAANWGE